MDTPVVERDNEFCTARVTCRDWFQLTLKEGLTVYRDQLFSADLGSAAVKRIEDVRALRAAQFPEDAGPTAHPIRPDSYIAMDNFYTAVSTPALDMDDARVVDFYWRLMGCRCIHALCPYVDGLRERRAGYQDVRDVARKRRLPKRDGLVFRQT